MALTRPPSGWARPRPSALGLATALACAAIPAGVHAECEPGREVLVVGLGADADLLRLASLTGAAPGGSEFIRRAGARTERLCADAPDLGWTGHLPAPPAAAGGIALVPVRIDGTWSLQAPIAANDGLLWQGRGFGAAASLGAYARWGPLTAAVAPEVAWQQNAWFETVPTGRPGNLAFANPWYGDTYDMPQRFGAGPFATFSPGQSYVRLDAYGIAAGLSTENLWLGPGARTSIMLTDAAPGFPHVFLGTSSPVDIGIGKLEVLAFWGKLDRSPYTADESQPWFTGLALGWEPRWVPGLYFGVARAFTETAASMRKRLYLPILEPPWKSALPEGDNPQDNQLAALWFRWVLPASALELYGEWAKDDFPASVGALIRETERTQAWLLGMQKVGRAWGLPLRVHVEFAKIAGGGWPMYIHDGGLGWTNGGQSLGSYAGPGGILSFLAVDVLGERGRIGGFVERLERNTTVFDAMVARDPTIGRDTEFTAGVRAVLVSGVFEVSGELAGGYRWNRDFLRDEPVARASISIQASPTSPRPRP